MFGTSRNEVDVDKLVADLKLLAHDAEELLKATTDDLSDRVKDARARLGQSLTSAKSSYNHVEERIREGVEKTDRTIREHPYQTIGAAFGVGLLIGVLVNRK